LRSFFFGVYMRARKRKEREKWFGIHKRGRPSSDVINGFETKWESRTLQLVSQRTVRSGRRTRRLGLPNMDKTAIDNEASHIYATCYEQKTLRTLNVPHSVAGIWTGVSIVSNITFPCACHNCNIQAWLLNKEESLLCLSSVYGRGMRYHRDHSLNAFDINEF
jgi:hypothetical protein